MATDAHLDYAGIMAMVASLVNIGEVFDTVDLRQLADSEENAMAINRAILQMSGYQDPVFERISRGRYRWLRYHSPSQRGSYTPAIKTAGTCPSCHLTLPASGECGYC